VQEALHFAAFMSRFCGFLSAGLLNRLMKHKYTAEQTGIADVRFEVLTAVTMKNRVF
jgi:hypothetical protein